jgi:hypothetical protein
VDTSRFTPSVLNGDPAETAERLRKTVEALAVPALRDDRRIRMP